MATPRPRTPREAFAAARTPGTVVAGSAAGLDGVTDLAGVPAGWTSGAAAGGNDGDGRVAWLAWVAWLAHLTRRLSDEPAPVRPPCDHEAHDGPPGTTWKPISAK